MCHCFADATRNTPTQGATTAIEYFNLETAGCSRLSAPAASHAYPQAHTGCHGMGCSPRGGVRPCTRTRAHCVCRADLYYMISLTRTSHTIPAVLCCQVVVVLVSAGGCGAALYYMISLICTSRSRTITAVLSSAGGVCKHRSTPSSQQRKQRL